MNDLKNIKWKEYKINELFTVTGSKTLSVNLLNKIGYGEYPYITTKSTNNGIDGFYKISTEEGNILTVDSAVLGYCFYQEKDFSASDHVEKLIPKFHFNKYIALFFQLLINKNSIKFSYGYKASQARLKSLSLLLPLTVENKPDLVFMEKFIKDIEEYKIKLYKNYILQRFNSLDKINAPKLNQKKWNEFYLNDIFIDIKRGKRFKKSNHQNGDKPYVSSSSSMNGIDGFIRNNKSNRIFENCLTIANSGSVGSTFYQPFEFIASDHVTKLENKNFNKYIYLFLSSIVKRLGRKYSFNREINDNRIKREKILLPINKNNEPDYEYMDNYMKMIEYKKIKQYLDYKNIDY